LLTGTNATNGPIILTSARATAFTNTYKSPPFSANTGAATVAGAVSTFLTTPIWVDVEVTKIGNVVGLNIDKSPVLRFTNNTPYTSGKLMLGYTDPYDSIGNPDGTAYFSNLRVLNLTVTPISITSVKLNGAQVQINFIGPSSDQASAFTLQSVSTVTGTFADVSATITGGTGSFQATIPVSGTTQFYRIRHN
jgi:hypothetical protein